MLVRAVSSVAMLLLMWGVRVALYHQIAYKASGSVAAAAAPAAANAAIPADFGDGTEPPAEPAKASAFDPQRIGRLMEEAAPPDPDLPPPEGVSFVPGKPMVHVGNGAPASSRP